RGGLERGEPGGHRPGSGAAPRHLRYARLPATAARRGGSGRTMNDIAARRQETVVLETSVKAFSKSALVLLALAVAGTPARSRSLHIGHRWLPLGMGTRRRGCGDRNRRRAGRAASLEAYRPLQREWAAGKARQD